MRRAALLVAVAAGACARAPRAEPPAPPSRTSVPSVERSRDARGGAVDEAGRIVRVALAIGARAPRIAATGEWRLYDESGRAVLARVADGAAWTIERRGALLRAVGPRGATEWREGPLVARSIALGGFLTFGGKRYRGELWAHAAEDAGPGAVTVVNRLPIEEYLRGVVPLELNAFAPADAAALEAQAVAARSYTYSRLPEFEPREVAIRQARRPFDLRATVSDQVYGGVDAERAASDRAIRATARVVIRYGGAVVSAPYHSACGGTTAEPQELWQGAPAPYLRRVSDRVPGTTDRHYCDAAPRFRWRREYDAVSLESVLARYLRQYARGQGTPGRALGAARAIRIEEHTPSGRVGALAVDTDAGRFVLRGNDIRFVLRTAGGDILPSTYFSVETAGDGTATGGDGRLTRVTLRGNGNGHGVGMCQWGAIGRARAGHDYRAILRAYFPGTTVEPAE